jgi:hypothetical protein
MKTYHNSTVSRGPDWAPFGGRITYVRGYPVPHEEVKVGYMNNAEIMADVDDEGIIEQTRTANNEVTRTMADGRIICRLRETDIAAIYPSRCFALDTGGWNTPTTRNHMQNFLQRHGFLATVGGSKKRGGIILRMKAGGFWREIAVFKERITVFKDGQVVVDDDHGPRS